MMAGPLAPAAILSWTQYDYLNSANGSLFITTTNGSLLPGYTYAVFDHFADGGAPPYGFVITNGYYEVLSLQLLYPLTTPGFDPIVLSPWSL